VIPSRETLERLQRRWEFRSDALEMVLRLIDLLRGTYEDPFLAARLVLKGGTALNLCFGEVPRLSVDLDFNDIGALDRDLAIEERQTVMVAMERIARRRGYRVQRSAFAHAGQKLYLGYGSALGGDRRVEVDVNFLFRLPLDPVENCTVWSPGGDPPALCRVVGRSELVAGKLLALLDRTAPRDLYDVAHLPERGDRFCLHGRTRRIFIALSGTLPHPLSKYGRSRLERVTDDEITRALPPMLRAAERPTGGELRDAAWRVIAPLLDLTEAEREYVERVQLGDLRPELVFPEDGEMAERLRRHPALLWKAENARRHTRKRSNQTKPVR
jgi:hypothetical protein